MKNILILLFALFAVALKADDRTVPGRTLSVTPQNALIHLPEFRKRSYKAVSYTHLDVYKRQVVYGKVAVSGSHVTITGRGILSGAKLAHTGETYAHGALLIETNANRLSNRGYFTISGITVVDSPNWTLSVYNTDHVMSDNINILCWILNGDGIDLCSAVSYTHLDVYKRQHSCGG